MIYLLKFTTNQLMQCTSSAYVRGIYRVAVNHTLICGVCKTWIGSPNRVTGSDHWIGPRLAKKHTKIDSSQVQSAHVITRSFDLSTNQLCRYTCFKILERDAWHTFLKANIAAFEFRFITLHSFTRNLRDIIKNFQKLISSIRFQITLFVINSDNGVISDSLLFCAAFKNVILKHF